MAFAPSSSLAARRQRAFMAALPIAAAMLKARATAKPELPWKPNPGAQQMVVDLIEKTKVDQIWMLGEAGAGKTYLGACLPLTHFQNVVFFRREYTDLNGAAGIIDTSRAVLSNFGGYNANERRWRVNWGGKARNLVFAGCQTEVDRFAWQGRAHDCYIFDEVTQFTPAMVDYIPGWRRSSDPNQRTVELYFGNPPIDATGEWVVDRIRPWVDPSHPRRALAGEIRYFLSKPDGTEMEVDGPEKVKLDGQYRLPVSRAFVPSRLAENPTYANGEYAERLDKMPEPLRSILKNADFFAMRRDGANQVIPTAWVKAAQDRWTPTQPKDEPLISVTCDVARGGDDRTVVSPRYADWFGPLSVTPGAKTRSGNDIAVLVMPYLADRAGQFGYAGIDGEGVGSAAVDVMRENPNIRVAAILFGSGAKDIHGEDRLDKSGNIHFANLRAYSYWRLREALAPESQNPIALPPSRTLLADLTAPRFTFRSGRLVLEDKDSIKKRLGRSPDEGDAIAMHFSDVVPERWSASDVTVQGSAFDGPMFESISMEAWS